jgi:hypothetical protein
VSFYFKYLASFLQTKSPNLHCLVLGGHHIPTHVIDYKKDSPIGSIIGIPMAKYSRTLMKAIKIFDTDQFPDNLDYMA